MIANVVAITKTIRYRKKPTQPPHNVKRIQTLHQIIALSVPYFPP